MKNKRPKKNQYEEPPTIAELAVIFGKFNQLVFLKQLHVM